MSEEDFEIILVRAAEESAKRALLESIRLARRTAFQTPAIMLTAALILALIADVVVKFELFGTPPK